MSRPDHRSAPPRSALPGAEPDAFDLWLRQALRCAHDAALRDPVPDTLLALLDPAPQG